MSARTTSKDDDDIDIYSELPNFKYDENLLKLEGDNKALKTNVAELVKKVETLEIQLKTCEKTNANYRRNISMLFLSARREIERKDRTIAELRSRSFQAARRDFPRQNRNEEAVGGQNISRNSEGERNKPIPATNEPPVVNPSNKIGYTFTAGNSRSGLYKCKYPAKDDKAEVDEKSCKGNSVNSNKKSGCSNIVTPTEDSKEIRPKFIISSKSVADRILIDENRSNCSKNNADVREDCVERRGEGNKAEREQIETSLKRKLTINDDGRVSAMASHERNSRKSSSRSKSPVAFDRRRSPKTLNRKSSPISSDKRKSPINSSRIESSIAFERRRSPRTSDRNGSLITSDRRKSPRMSSRKHVEKRLSGSSGRDIRSGSVFRRLDHRSRSTRSRSHVLSTFRHSKKRDSVTRDVGLRRKLTAGESSKLIDCVKLGQDDSGLKSVPRSQTRNSEELKYVESNEGTKFDSSVVIPNQINSRPSSGNREINVESHAQVIQASENIPVDDRVAVSTTETKSADESTETKSAEESMEGVVKNQTTIDSKELERISLPPLIGPWTQFSIRRYKKLHGFSPVKPDSEKKKTVNIRCIEKKSLFENKIERTVVTKIDGRTTKEIINVQLDAVLESKKVSESRCDGETSNKTINIELDNDDKQPESNKSLEFRAALELCVLNDHKKDMSSNVSNQKHESGLQHNESSETLLKAEVVPIISESNKDDHSENEVTSSKSVADNKSSSDQVFGIDKDISHSIVNSELSVESILRKEASNCIGNGKSDELTLEKCTDSKLLTNNRENEAPIINITDNITPESVSIPLKEPVKEISSSMYENSKDFDIVTGRKNDSVVESENQVDYKDGIKVMNEINVDATSVGGQRSIENEDNNKVVTEKENCGGENEQLKLSTYETDNEKREENENVVSSCENVLLTSSTENEDTEKICSEVFSGDLQTSYENEVLESNVEGEKMNDGLEKMDDGVDTTVKEQEIESTVLKGVFITESASNAESPEIDESPTDKSDSKLTVEKPKIIDNISSSLHTFNSALDFSISTTNTNSLNADNNIEQQKQKAQLSASSLQVVNALKKLPKIRENFLQLFGESSNQDNTGAETPSEGNASKPCSNTTSNKESKSLSCSSSLSSSSSSLSSSSSSITQSKSSESTIPQVIRLFGIDITEEHSPFHVSKSASQNSILDDKMDEVSPIAENCLKSTTDNKLTVQNKSEMITGENDSVLTGQVGAIPENKSIVIDSPLDQVVTIESKKISETKIVESSVVQEKHCEQEKTVISKEIICEEPVIFPVPIIVVDKVSDDKSSIEKPPQENKVTVEYYSNFTEALRNETNVSTSKSDVAQPEFQFESPSRYIMRINNNSVTSHKGLEMTESQSITGEDTLTMVRRLAKPLDTISPIKTPSKRSVSRKPTTIESPDDTVSPIKTLSKRSVSRKLTTIESSDDDCVIENKGEKEVKKRMTDSGKKVIENEKNLVEYEKKIAENENKLAENKNKLVENKNKLADNLNKLADNANKLADNSNTLVDNSNKLVDNSNKLADNSNKLADNSNKLAVNDKKIEGSHSSCIVEQPKPVAKKEVRTSLDFIAKKDKVSVSLSSEHFEFRRRRSSRPIVKLKSSCISLVNKQEEENKSKIVTDQQNDQKVVKQVTTPPKSNKQNEPKRPATLSKKDITQNISTLASKKESIVEKQRLPSPKNEENRQKLSHQSLRKDAIGDNHLSSPKIAPILGKRPLIIPRNDTVQRTQGFKRRRVVVNRFALNDVIKLGPTNEKMNIGNSGKNCEQKYPEKKRSSTASTSGLGRPKIISEATDVKVNVKRMNDNNEKSPGKQLKVDNSVSVSRKSEEFIASGKGVNETRNSSHHRLRDQVDSVPESSLARSSAKVSDTARTSKRSGVIDLKTDFCERRSPSEYFNRRSTMNRRQRILLRDKKLQRCRSPLVTRRKVDKYMMNMRETRERKETRNRSERSVSNDVGRRLNCDSSIKWKLKPVDIKLPKNGSLFERLVAENVLNKLENPRTFIMADPTELTPPPMVIPCSNDSRVLVDQSNRSNQLSSSPGTAQSTDTPKSTNNTPEPVSSEIISPKPASNKIVIIRRRSNNTPKVLGDSAGTFIKTNAQVNSAATEEKAPISVRRERSNAIPCKLEDSPRSETNLTDSTKVTLEQASCNPKPFNEHQKNDLKKDCESNSRIGPVRSTRIVKTQLDFRSRLRRSRK